MSDHRAFPAFSYPNYRLWFFGQMTSLFGTWMQSTAQGYLMFELTRSSAFLGYTGFASGLATWVFILWGGLAADRLPRRNLLVVTQSLAMLLAFSLSALTFSGMVAPWHIIVMSFLLGVVNAFDGPARLSFTLELVERRDLTNAIALNATMFNTAVAAGPATGGLIYAWFGPGWCFAINGLSYVAVIAALLSMRLAPFVPPARTGSALGDVAAGLRAVRADRRILALIALMSCISLFGMSFTTILPAWAVNVLAGDSRTNGFLQAARGLGAMLAALGMASLGRFNFRGRLLTAASFVFPFMLILFSFTQSLPFSLAVLFMVGVANISINNVANSLVQTLAPNDLRGRVMSIYQLCFLGLMPVGALIAGVSAHAWGENQTVAICAIATLACTATVALAAPAVRKLE
jgi:MFS family permease